MPFPLLKLVSLLVKRRLAPLSESIQKVIEQKAVQNAKVKKMCTVPADLLQKLDKGAYNQRADQAPVNLDKKIFVGADIIAEGIFWALLGVIMYAEYRHARYKARRREEQHVEKYRALEREISDLKSANDAMVIEIRQLNNVIANMTHKMQMASKS